MDNVSPSGLANSSSSRLTLGLVSCGGIGALLFSAVYLVEGATRPGYDAWRQPISALSLGPGGWAQRLNFVGFGLLMAISAAGWYRVLSGERNAIAFPALQVISGLCLIGAGLFSMDPFPGYPPGSSSGRSTPHGALHTVFAWALILVLAQGCFTLPIYLWRAPRWRGWALYSWVTGALILIFWGMFVKNATGSLAGLYERISAGSHALWLVSLSAALVFSYRTGGRSRTWKGVLG